MPLIIIALSVVVGIVLGLGLAVWAFLGVTAEAVRWLEDWNTLIGGALTLAGGLSALIGVSWQTRESARGLKAQLAADSDARKDTIHRKRIATRALLQSDLSHICHYTDRSAEVISTAIATLRDGDKARTPKLEMPEFPWNILGNLQNLIEHLTHPEAEVIADLLAAQQIHNARLRTFVTDYNRNIHQTENDAEFLVQKCVELRIRADATFDFARRKINTLNQPCFSKDELANGLRVLHLFDIISDKCKEEVEQHIDALAHRVRTEPTYIV